jgi:hypothetical protein
MAFDCVRNPKSFRKNANCGKLTCFSACEIMTDSLGPQSLAKLQLFVKS